MSLLILQVDSWADNSLRYWGLVSKWAASPALFTLLGRCEMWTCILLAKRLSRGRVSVMYVRVNPCRCCASLVITAFLAPGSSGGGISLCGQWRLPPLADTSACVKHDWCPQIARTPSASTCAGLRAWQTHAGSVSNGVGRNDIFSQKKKDVKKMKGKALPVFILPMILFVTKTKTKANVFYGIRQRCVFLFDLCSF